jgi:ABC-type taurine transport system substrate-binding protein
MRYLAYFSLGDDLCRKNPASAAAWAAQLPPGDDHLAAVHGIALIWARGDIAAATVWIKQLDPQDMKRAAQAVAEAWGGLKGKGGPTLEGWLDQLSLSATDKEDVLKGPRPDELNYSKYQPTPSSAAH